MLLAIATAVHTSLLAVDVDINSDNQVDTIESVIGNIILISIVLGAIAAIWKVFTAGRHFSHQVDQFFADWSGEPAREGVPERPGILSRMKVLEDLRDTQTTMLEDLSTQISTMSRHVSAELNRNGGSSTKDAAHEALRVAKEIQKQQEHDARERQKWHDTYRADQVTMRKEWGAVFVAISTMIPKTPEEQAKIWAEITKSYGDGTILDTHPVDVDDKEKYTRP
jgi:hypothetical protein